MSKTPERDENAEDALESIRHFFSPGEWKECSVYDKRSYWSAARNYRAMIKAGINARKPYFMLSEQERASVLQGGKGTPLARPGKNTVGRAKKKHGKKQKSTTPTSTPTPRPAPSVPARASRRIRERYHLEDEGGKGDQGQDEDILYCDECQRHWMGDCPHHGALQEVPDAEAPVGRPCRASATVPPCLLSQVGYSGIWSRELIPQRVRFGPYEGDVVHTDTEDVGNWMRLVRFAKKESAASANLRPFEYCGRLYYRTVCDIPAGCELLVGFMEGAKDPGAEWSRLSCGHCGRHFDVPALLAQHQRAAAYCAEEERRRRRARVAQLAARLPGNVMEAEKRRKLVHRAELRQEKVLREQRGAARRAQQEADGAEANKAEEAARRQRELEEAEAEASARLQEQQREARLRELEELQRQQVDRIVAIEMAIAGVGAGAEGGHACETCGRTFRRGSLLRAHLATHPADRISSLGCPDCVADPRHRRKHRNQWPTYSCSSCTATFATGRDLRDHVKLIHVILKGKKPREATATAAAADKPEPQNHPRREVRVVGRS
ncbi:hypothetical protein ONE63_010582 [Megalurothrips usitatus]|uniref:Zinc finger protein n=1 Tax=Megalurothrips usitatus TaxID=439358 RepID=A0AAV7XJX6_9NEOP|nr:hypothetical protein ONE63_010582 [Megalurothrips usitatus]